MVRQANDQRLKLYIVTHRKEDSSAWHWTLTLCPEKEIATSRKKSTMWYRTLRDPETKQRHYMQTAKESLKPSEAVARIFIGRVASQHQPALEQLIADPRHIKSDVNSRGWVETVLKVLVSSRKLASEVVVNPGRAMLILERFSTNVITGAYTGVGDGLPPTMMYL